MTVENTISKNRLMEIIEEEALGVVHEGLLDSVASNAKSLLHALALTSALSGGGAPAMGAPRAPAASQKSDLRSIEVSHMLADKINAGKHKDRFGLDIVASTADPKIKKLGKLTLQLFNEWGHDEQTVEQYTETVYQILKVGLQHKGSAASIYDYVSEILIKKLKKRKAKKTITISNHEFRNNPLLIQQAFLSVHMEKTNLKANLNKLAMALKRGVRDGDISNKQAKDIFKSISKPAAEGLKVINRILNLN
jgi:hypothetical protein